MRSEEMAQPLRALTVLPEDLGSIPAPTWQFTIVCNSSSRGPNTHGKLLRHIFKKKKKKKQKN